MEVEERFGLKKRHTYDEIVAWLNSDPKGVPYPNRVAFQTYNSHVYGQLKDSLRSFTAGQDAYNAYQHGDEHAPFVPPRPQFRGPQQDPPPFGGGGPPDDDDDDDLMGPPGPGPHTYPDLLQPEARSSDQVLLNEGITPPRPPPPPPSGPPVSYAPPLSPSRLKEPSPTLLAAPLGKCWARPQGRRLPWESGRCWPEPLRQRALVARSAQKVPPLACSAARPSVRSAL